jgi:predicted transcriptional regulator
MARRNEITAMYLRGMKQMEIAEELGISQGLVSRDLSIVQKEWLKERTADFDLLKQKELAKIDELEREAWAEYKRSKNQRSTTMTEKVQGTLMGDVQKARVTKKESLGDARYLGIVQWCIDRRVKILGMDAPTKITPTTSDGQNELPGGVLIYIPDNGRRDLDDEGVIIEAEHRLLGPGE